MGISTCAPAHSPDLLSGKLEPVAAIALQVLGHTVDPRTTLRWCCHGRCGVKLPTVRGRRRSHYTTLDVFRWWLLATSDAAQSGQPATEDRRRPERDPGADQILAALSPKLARKGT